ncbi:hypothetical protein HK100_005667, partial [Physocladia obscura]
MASTGIAIAVVVVVLAAAGLAYAGSRWWRMRAKRRSGAPDAFAAAAATTTAANYNYNYNSNHYSSNATATVPSTTNNNTSNNSTGIVGGLAALAAGWGANISRTANRTRASSWGTEASSSSSTAATLTNTNGSSKTLTSLTFKKSFSLDNSNYNYNFNNSNTNTAAGDYKLSYATATATPLAPSLLAKKALPPLPPPSTVSFSLNTNNTSINNTKPPIVASPPTPMKSAANKSNKANVFVVTLPYSAAADDEMNLLNPGDHIYVLQIFDDGWAFGVDRRLGTRGIFPLACCTPLVDSPTSPQMLQLQQQQQQQQQHMSGDYEYLSPNSSTVFSRRQSSKHYTPITQPHSIASSNPRTSISSSFDNNTPPASEVAYVHPSASNTPFNPSKRMSSVDHTAALSIVSGGAGGGFSDLAVNPEDMEGVVAYYGSEGLVMRVVHSYEPLGGASDELSLVVGHDLIMLAEFEDGWGLGMLPLTGEKGAFPLPCVVRFEDAKKSTDSKSSSIDLES